jgi:hypothetical protein
VDGLIECVYCNQLGDETRLQTARRGKEDDGRAASR